MRGRRLAHHEGRRECDQSLHDLVPFFFFFFLAAAFFFAASRFFLAAAFFFAASFFFLAAAFFFAAAFFLASARFCAAVFFLAFFFLALGLSRSGFRRVPVFSSSGFSGEVDVDLRLHGRHGQRRADRAAAASPARRVGRRQRRGRVRGVRVDDLVAVVVGQEPVPARAAAEHVGVARVRVADQVRAAAGGEVVVRVEHVVAVVALELVAARAARQPVVAEAAGDDVVAVAGDDRGLGAVGGVVVEEEVGAADEDALERPRLSNSAKPASVAPVACRP